jgi:hypothetical protein
MSDTDATIYRMPVRPIEPAYSPALCRWDAGCTYCGAPGGQYCRRADGRIRRIPCIWRMIPRWWDVDPDEVTERRQAMRPAHAFGEPRHQAQA